MKLGGWVEVNLVLSQVFASLFNSRVTSALETRL
jgi:hypothetical protein